MAATCNATIALSVVATLNNALDVGSVSYPVAYSSVINLTDGTGANQCKEIFTDTRTLTASANEDLDLSGVLTNAFGTSLVFTKIKAIIVTADAANTNDVVIGGAASNQFSTMTGAVTDKIKVGPGGLFCVVAPNAAAYAVTAATGDLLRVTNGGAGTSVTYTVIIIGVV